MSKNDNTTLAETDWEAQFNAPREELLKKLFGDVQCPVSDLSPKTVIEDKNWNERKDFMVAGRPRIYKTMNPEVCKSITMMNDQLRSTGKIITTVQEDQLADFKAKPEPVK